MGKIAASDVVLKGLGLLLVVAAVLKGHELLTVPVANQDIWSSRAFLIFQVEFELALGIWLLSGVFKPLAWLAGVACFTLFCGVALYKALTGAASCGCFGTVHVNPWITLFAIDLPAAILLLVLRPKSVFGSLGRSWSLTLRLLHLFRRAGHRATRRSHSHAGAIVGRVVARTASIRSVVTMAAIAVVLGATTPILALNAPAKATAKYEVLEPETWVGKELPILEHIDIADQLRTGNWLVVLVHHDCPHCRREVPMIERMIRKQGGSDGFPTLALIELAPYSARSPWYGTSSANGRLANCKVWLVETPVAVLLEATKVKAEWAAIGSEITEDAIISALTRARTSSASKSHPRKGRAQETTTDFGKRSR